MPPPDSSKGGGRGDSPDIAISVRDLHVRYGTREILHGVNFEVPAGETLVIMGGSGCGKSTLLRTLVGLERPSAGEIWIRVALPLREHTKLDESTIEIMVRLKLDQVGLSGFDNYMPAQLSGGMKKRAAIARALAMDPEILFFDEPSAGLDPIIAAGLDELILKLKKAFRITILVVTHELASAFLIADRMILLDKGYVAANGTPDELRQNTSPRVRQFLDRVPEPELAAEIDYLQMLTGEVPPERR
jgi:phospholipid/cholesterol/gamma-HCH transport system ATP-binding protein